MTQLNIMKNKMIILISAIIFVISCHQQNDPKPVSGIAANPIEKDSVTKEITKDSLPQKALFPGSDTLFFKLKMDSLNKHVTVPVLISSGEKLFASLLSDDTKANIRISQIGFPDSTFDGPFGRNLHYTIKTPGTYKLIIGENMMAGDPWKGNFRMKVWVE